MTETVETVPAPKQRMRQRLHFDRLQLMEHGFKGHLATIPADVSPSTVATEDYWAHVVGPFGPMDIIRAFWEDGTKEIWFTVLFVSPAGVKLSKLFEVEHEPAGDDEEDIFKAQWRGPHAQWCVIRTDSKIVIKDKMQSKSEAMGFLANYLRGVKV